MTYTIKDLENKATWTTGEGWSPISLLGAVLEGNGNTISRLRISRDQGQGLFSRLGGSVLIRNLGLLRASVGKTGIHDSGGFVNNLGGGRIINSYVQGNVRGFQNIGGLAGIGSGGIANSYGKGLTISSTQFSGGLYGRNQAWISNSYIRGTINGRNVGAMAGQTGGSISNTYAATENGRLVKSDAFVNTRGLSNNYTRPRSRHDELKQPTGPDHPDPVLYVGWDTDRWDFGTSEQFPILKYFEQCSNNPQTRRTDQPECGTFLPDQDDGLRDLETMTPGLALDKVFASETTNYELSFSNDTPNLEINIEGLR